MKKSSPVTVLKDEAACAYGAGVLLKHLLALEEEVHGVRAGSADIEFVHRARVASRRLRAALPLFQTCLPARKNKKWLAEIREVTRALGDARDADVQIERLEKFSQTLEEARLKPGINRLMLRLRQRRERLQAPAASTVDHLLQSGVLDQMRASLAPLADHAGELYLYTPPLYQHSLNSIQARLNAFLSFQEVMRQPEKVAELHQMRIAAKWLRYTLETFAPLYASQLKPQLQAVRKTQDLLGEIHDCDVWQEFLPVFLQEERLRAQEYFGHTRSFNRLAPGILAFQSELQQVRERLYAEFIQGWDGWHTDQIWDQLRQTIQAPILQPDAIYPPPSAATIERQSSTPSEA